MTQEKWDHAHWRTKFWWLRKRLYRTITARGIHAWWKDAHDMLDSYADLVNQWYGVSRREQLARMSQLRFCYGVEPWEYYGYKLYRPERYSKRGRYIFHHPHLQLINFFILHTIGHYQTPTQGDKRRWHAWALENLVATPKIIATFEDGFVTSWNWNGDPDALPERDLFCKPTSGYGGSGANLWACNGSMYQSHGQPDVKLGKADLIEHLKSRKGSLLLQERIVNHPEWKGLTPFGLATCRLVTGRSVDGKVVPIAASIKLPRGSSITDNPSSGSVVAPIEINNGCLGIGVTKFPQSDGDRLRAHPDTGKKIAGKRLPYWENVKELAVDTHGKLDHTHFVGWDITLSANGPIIIEPNAAFGASSAEYPDGIPLTDTMFGVLFDEWLTQAVLPTG